MPIQELERADFEQTVDTASEEAKKYRQHLTVELIKLDTKIDAMAANVKQASADVQSEYELRLAELNQQRQTLDQRLTELQQASGSAFETLKTGLETAWQDLADTFQAMHDDFNQKTH